MNVFEERLLGVSPLFKIHQDKKETQFLKGGDREGSGMQPEGGNDGWLSAPILQCVEQVLTLLSADVNAWHIVQHLKHTEAFRSEVFRELDISKLGEKGKINRIKKTLDMDNSCLKVIT